MTKLHTPKFFHHVLSFCRTYFFRTSSLFFSRLVLFSALLFALFLPAHATFAKFSSSAGDGGASNIHGDANCTSSRYLKRPAKCYIPNKPYGGGASWHLYRASEDEIAIHPATGKSGKITIQGGTIRGCKSNGGWYFRYGAEGTGHLGSEGKQIGLIPMKESGKFGAGWAQNDAGTTPFTPISPSNLAIKAQELKNKAAATGPDGLRVDWTSVSQFFKYAREAEINEKPAGAPAGPLESRSWNSKSDLSWFCFDFEKLIGAKFHTRSFVSVGERKKWSKFDDTATLGEVDLKEGQSVDITFKHFVYSATSEEQELVDDIYFKNNFKTSFDSSWQTIQSSGGQVTYLANQKDPKFTQISESFVDKNTTSGDPAKDWRRSNDGTKPPNTKTLWVIDVKHTEQIKVSHDMIKSDRIKICEAIGLKYDKVESKDGILQAVPSPSIDQPKSSACVIIKKQSAPPPPADDFCKAIIDSNANFGNDAAFSLVANLTKGGVMPEGDALFQDNDGKKPSSNLRMTEISGGNQKIKAGGSAPFLYAKPYDSIQFRHVLCYGSLAVTSLSKEAAKSAGGSGSRKFKSPNAVFNISAQPDSSHLFGNDIASGAITISTNPDNGELKAIGIRSGKTPRYGLPLDSPSQDNPLPCDNDNEIISGAGFQIPGKDNCLSREKDKSSAPVDKHDVGKTITQSISFTERKIWTGGISPEDGNLTPGECACNKKRSELTVNQGDYAGAREGSYTQDFTHDPCAEDGECSVTESCCDSSGKNCKPCTKKYTKYKNGTDKVIYTPMHKSETPHNFSVSVRIPYNFLLELESADFPKNREEFLYPGEVISPPKIKATVKPRKNPDIHSEPYATRTPKLKTGFVKFLISQDAEPSILEESGLKAIKGGGANKKLIKDDQYGNNICKQLGINHAEIIGCEHQDLSTEQVLNPKGLYNPQEPEEIELTNLAIPDVDAGHKFCIASAVYPADSHGMPELVTEPLPSDAETLQEQALEDNIYKDKHWLIGGVACRTIVKKPNFQVWNGGVFADQIQTSLTDKIVGATLSTSANTPLNGRFGSWSEFETVATGNLKGFASGATLGYSKDFNSILPLSGGANPNTHYNPSLVPQTIANVNSVGHANLLADNTLPGRLRARYTTLPNSIPTPSALSSSCFTPNDPGCNKNGAKLIKATTATLPATNLPIPNPRNITNNFASNTFVVSAQTVNIDGNICYGDCANPPKFTSIAQIPQLLIFADEINIASHVTHLDAWLIAKNKVNTCLEFSQDPIQSAKNSSPTSTTSEPCASQLTINGPIFIGDELNPGGFINLYRTAGAYPGDGKAPVTPVNSARVANFPQKPLFNLASDGSITPAEIFHLHPAAYLWSFNQSQRLTQAIVTHSQELPPRF